MLIPFTPTAMIAELVDVMGKVRASIETESGQKSQEIKAPLAADRRGNETQMSAWM